MEYDGQLLEVDENLFTSSTKLATGVYSQHDGYCNGAEAAKSTLGYVSSTVVGLWLYIWSFEGFLHPLALELPQLSFTCDNDWTMLAPSNKPPPGALARHRDFPRSMTLASHVRLLLAMQLRAEPPVKLVSTSQSRSW